MATSLTYIGAKPTDVVAGRQVYRLSIRRLFSLALWRPSWETTIATFVDRLPGSGVAFVVGYPSVDSQQGVAVADVMIPTTIAGVGAVTLGDVVRKIEEFLPGADIDRVVRVSGESLEATVSNRERELGAAAERDREADQRESWLERLERSLKGAGLAALLVAGVVLLIYAGIVRGRLQS